MVGIATEQVLVVHYVLYRLGSCVPVTKLRKVLFLCDCNVVKRLGRRPFFTWVKYLYGPYSREVEAVVEYLVAEGCVVREV